MVVVCVDRCLARVRDAFMAVSWVCSSCRDALDIFSIFETQKKKHPSKKRSKTKSR